MAYLAVDKPVAFGCGMERQRNIYETRKAKPEGPQNGLPVDQAAARFRARTLRNTIGFSVVMLVLFAASVWFIYQEEENRKQASEVEPLLGVPSLAPPPAVTNLPAPEGPPPPPSDRVTDTVEVPQIEPEKMAQAMGETRIAYRYLQARELNKAEQHARRALEIAPDMNAALRTLGMIYVQRGQFDQSILLLEKALNGDPYNPETYSNLGIAYMQKGMLGKAEELLQTALQLSPGYHVAFLNLGLLALMRGRYDSAADYLERGLELVPNDPVVRNNLAVSLMRLGRYEESRKHLDVIIETRPSTSSAYFNMAITYVLEGNFEAAMQWIESGSRHCSPVACQKFLADSDFNPIRKYPPFKAFVESLYPDLPAPPEGS